MTDASPTARRSGLLPPAAELFAGGGKMGARVRQFDWAGHPLGPPETWPQSLRTIVRVLLTSRFAMWMGWGPDFHFFFNDAYAPTLGIKQEWALGAKATEVWKEIWKDIGPRAMSVVTTGQATWDESLLLFLERRGFKEETYHTFSYSPLPDDSGAVGGMLCVVTEETDRVISERRMAQLRDLAAELAVTQTEQELFQVVPEVLAKDARDLPFALIYLFDGEDRQARLASAHGTEPGSDIAPMVLNLEHEGGWPLRGFLVGTRTVRNLDKRFKSIPSGPWDISPTLAVAVPLSKQPQEAPAGFLIAGINPYRPYDSAYRGFVEVLAGQIAGALTNVRANEQERERARRLAELDLAKTNFFSNVSHEFRTPLTLMLGPLEKALHEVEHEGPPAVRDHLEVARRNSLRLLKLVNALLDFSRIEAGRIQASFEPVDLAAITADLASTFRSAVENAGMRLKVESQPIPEPVYVDREMWEKVVLNLLSNAFKHTLQGEISVALQAAADGVELTVQDTGSGIPAEALPRLFERFFRVPGARARTHEGSGIGLALVQELVKLHGGSIRVESKVGDGSRFIVWIPLGHAHLPPEQIREGRPAHPAVATSIAEGFIQEARGWAIAHHDTPMQHFSDEEARARIVLADDNADMRAYVGKLLSPHHDLEVVADGAAALAAVRRQRPDLILTDVMMPELDGFGLLHAIRNDPTLSDVPVIMLSARAGEESRIEGHEAGADDYLVKPFSERELLATIASNIRLARVRRRSAEEVRHILDCVTDAFIAVDSEWRFRYVNRSFVELAKPLFTSASELLGRNMWECFPDEKNSAASEFCRRTMERQVPGTFEARYGEPGRWLEFHAYPSPEMLSVTIRDITDRKDAQAALEEAKENAEAANRSKDHFLAVLSHELRTPLTPVLMTATGYETDPATPPALKNDMAMIRRNVELETQLIDDLLDLSRIANGKLVLRTDLVDVREIIHQVCAICRPQILEKRITLHCEEAPQAIWVSGDPARLQQVLWNLLHNAVKFTPESGRIEITTRAFADGTAHIRVLDTGRGIPAELLPRIFNAFEQGDSRTTRQFGGLGLGLAITRALVELHKGQIEAASEGPGHGAAFTVILPLEADRREVPSASHSNEAAASPDHLRLLVVEDHSDTAFTLGALLRRQGFSVRLAGNVTEALDAVDNETFDLVISDLGLPDGTGFDLLGQIREKHPLPAIAMSGYGMESDLIKSRQAGFNEHLIKPVNLANLKKAIERVMRQSELKK